MKIRRFWSAFVLVVGLVVGIAPAPAGAVGLTFFVNINVVGGANDGTSWANAFTDLQAGMNAAGPDDELWVAQGTYTRHATDRSMSFVPRGGSRIYGGFIGTETTVDQADPDSNPTILSGDLLGNDNGNIDIAEPTRADNSIHVVTYSAGTPTELNGITISGAMRTASLRTMMPERRSTADSALSVQPSR